MIDGLESMQQAIDAIKAALEAEENQQARKSIAQLRALIENFEDQFKRRIDIIRARRSEDGEGH